MAKQDEKSYFKKIGDEGVVFSLGKPFSDRINAGALLHNVGAVLSAIGNEFADKTISIVDVGCGSGWTSNMFAQTGHEVVGVDIAPEAINAARKAFIRTNLSYEVVDYDDLSKLGTFDVAIFIDSLHHSDNPVKTLTSIRKILKAGGICVVCEPGTGHSTALDAIEAVKKYGVTEQDMPPRLIKRAARKAGFKRFKTYAHPSFLHRLAYKEAPARSLRASIIGFPGMRAVGAWYAVSLKKRDEGLVILYR